MTHPAEWIGRSPAIARVNNAEAERWEEDTDREQIVLLYDMLLHLAPRHQVPSGDLTYFTITTRPSHRTSRQTLGRGFIDQEKPEHRRPRGHPSGDEAA